MIMGKMKYLICDCCGKEFPKNITYFKKYSRKTEDAKILMSDPAIRQWMKLKGIL